MRSPRSLLLVALIGLGVTLSACTGHPASDDSAAVETSPTPRAAPTATATPVPDVGPVEAFRSWWTAVRAADTVAACGALTPALQQRMITEYTASIGVEVEDCAALIRQTSSLYAVTGMSHDAEVTLVSQQGDESVLDVAYVGGGCGTVHLSHASGAWMLTELSQECEGR